MEATLVAGGNVPSGVDPVQREREGREREGMKAVSRLTRARVADWAFASRVPALHQKLARVCGERASSVYSKQCIQQIIRGYPPVHDRSGAPRGRLG